MLAEKGLSGTKIVVGMGSCGVSAGARKVYEAVKNEVTKRNLDVRLEITGCLGACYREVMVEVLTPQHGRVIYGNVSPELVPQILEEHVIKGNPIKERVVRSDSWETGDDVFFKKQKRIVLRNCGSINPESIEDYLAVDGYKALEETLKSMTPQEVIDMVALSGLRGRGGAGFPTGKKWMFTRQASGDKKYVICNADEGDPGAFMDRVIIESDPHSMLEGMLIAGYAVGADEGFVYIREEYPLAVKRLMTAIEQAERMGFLGENILDLNFNFDVHIRRGAGAFVCGEETALIASIEGRRGMPRMRPPFPANSGLWGKPTCINNVKTLVSVPWIILHGADAFNVYGVGKSRGTAVFSLTGKVVRGGLVEVPMGTSLREIIFDIGGGIKDGRAFKAVQTGGPSGGCIPARLAETGVDYESLTETGSIMGSGGMVVMDETTCMVDIAKFFLNFTQNESCGKCTFCRLGTKRMLEVLTRITEGKGRDGDIELLEELAQKVKVSSLCGLGQTAPNPVLTTIKYFRDEYKVHVHDKKCPAHRCKALLSYWIIPENCVGCGVCLRLCPVQAISGRPKEPHVIDGEKCIRCGACREECKFDAVGAA